MPDVTTKLGLKKPVGTETVNRAAYNENLDILELMAAREQFPIKSLTYNAGSDRIEITLGPGIAETFNLDATALISKTTDTIYYINTPAINTTYYIYLQADGNFAHNTTGVIPTGTALLWTVITGAAVDTLTALDKRAVLSAAGAKVAAHLAEYVTHDHTGGKGATIPTAGIAANAVTQSALANGIAVSSTASTSYVDMPDMTTTLNIDGGDLLVWFNGSVYGDTVGKTVYVALSIDGTTETANIMHTVLAVNSPLPAGIIFKFIANAGSHTIKVRWKVDGGTGYVQAMRKLLVVEVKR